MTDDQLVEALATQLWGMNLDRDAHSIARDLVPTVRAVAPLVATPQQRGSRGATPHPAPPTLAERRADRWGIG